MKKMFSIVLIHHWTRERRTVPVEVVANTYVTVRWGIAGLYDLHLRKNELRARNPKAHRKHGIPLWSAEDIGEVRRLVRLYHGETDERIEDRIRRHNLSMPYGPPANDANPRIQTLETPNPRIQTCPHGFREETNCSHCDDADEVG